MMEKKRLPGLILKRALEDYDVLEDGVADEWGALAALAIGVLVLIAVIVQRNPAARE